MKSFLEETFHQKRVLITGGLGFIGSNLARRLLQFDARVTIVDNLAPNYGGNPYNLHGIEQDVHTIIADICDKAQVGDILPQQDFLFNLAAQISHLGSMQDPSDDLEANAAGQLTLLEMCRHRSPAIRIVYAGTRQVYGRPQYLPVDEQHPLEPVDFNGVSKLAGEWYHRVSHQVYQLRTSCLRMTNVYGPRMRVRDARKSFIGLWFRQLIEGQDIPIYGDGKQLRDFNYVEDVVEALLLCAASPQAEGQVYNLGAEPLSLVELARLMISIYGSGAYHFEPFPPERQRIDIGDYYGNYNKIHNQLGWSTLTSLQEGIAQTLTYYQANREFYFL